jgi:hypothetical protein
MATFSCHVTHLTYYVSLTYIYFLKVHCNLTTQSFRRCWDNLLECDILFERWESWGLGDIELGNIKNDGLGKGKHLLTINWLFKGCSWFKQLSFILMMLLLITLSPLSHYDLWGKEPDSFCRKVIVSPSAWEMGISWELVFELGEKSWRACQELGQNHSLSFYRCHSKS